RAQRREEAAVGKGKDKVPFDQRVVGLLGDNDEPAVFEGLAVDAQEGIVVVVIVDGAVAVPFGATPLMRPLEVDVSPLRLRIEGPAQLLEVDQRIVGGGEQVTSGSYLVQRPVSNPPRARAVASIGILRRQIE